jgi:hypothetical protein
MVKVKLIQHVEQLSTALQKCDNSWVAEQIVAHKIKNKRENLIKRMPDNVVLSKSRSATPAGRRPRPSASSFNSTLSTTVATDDDYGDLDDAPSSNNADPYDDVAGDTSFQIAPPADPTTAATCYAEIKSICNTPPLRRGRAAARGGGGRGGKQQSAGKTQAFPISHTVTNDVAEGTERKPSRKIRENQEIEEATSAKRKAEEELKEGRDRIAKKSRANLVELFKKWTEEAGEMYEEVEREILWLGGVKFVGEYRGGRQTWTQAEPDEVDEEEEVIED